MDSAELLYESVFPEGIDFDWDRFATVGWLDNYASAREWSPELGLDALGSRAAKQDEHLRHGFHLSRWRGRSPGCFVWRGHYSRRRSHP